ncbi:MAG: hypothetical protein ACJ74H_15435, partial [Thermoanaerobaculia bacterium]
MTRRERLLSIAFAVWGLAIAIAMIAIWDRPATPDQLPGTARSQGFDAHGPFRWIAGLMLLPVLLPLVLNRLLPSLTGEGARRADEGSVRTWAFNTI